MKVIGKVDSDTYLCQVSHREIEKFMDLYSGKRGRLEVGDAVDLSKGYDFYYATKVALEKTEEFIKANKDVIDTILTGISIMTRGGEQR
jgi:hypothetical protein